MDETAQPNRRALDGVRVLDLTHQVAGPSSTLILAFLGAEVVKVIAPGSRDSYDPIPFYLNNASKKSVELDLKSGAGVATARRLAEQADIFVENFSPGVIDRLGQHLSPRGRQPGLPGHPRRQEHPRRPRHVTRHGQPSTPGGRPPATINPAPAASPPASRTGPRPACPNESARILSVRLSGGRWLRLNLLRTGSGAA